MKELKKLIEGIKELFYPTPGIDKDVPCTTYIYDYVPVSTFKDRAEEIKRKYNHKFHERGKISSGR
jgi:hypothetical protein